MRGKFFKGNVQKTRSWSRKRSLRGQGGEAEGDESYNLQKEKLFCGKISSRSRKRSRLIKESCIVGKINSRSRRRGCTLGKLTSRSRKRSCMVGNLKSRSRKRSNTVRFESQPSSRKRSYRRKVKLHEEKKKQYA